MFLHSVLEQNFLGISLFHKEHLILAPWLHLNTVDFRLLWDFRYGR